MFFTFVTAFLASSCSSGLDCGSWMYYCQVFIAAVSFIAWTYGAGSDQDKALSGKAGVFAYRMLNAAFFAWCMHVLVFGKDPNMGSLRSGDNWTADNTYVHRMWALHVAMFAISSRWTPYSDLRQVSSPCSVCTLFCLLIRHSGTSLRQLASSSTAPSCSRLPPTTAALSG